MVKLYSFKNQEVKFSLNKYLDLQSGAIQSKISKIIDLAGNNRLLDMKSFQSLMIHLFEKNLLFTFQGKWVSLIK